MVNGSLQVVSLWARAKGTGWLVEVSDVNVGDHFLVFSRPEWDFVGGADVSTETIENRGLLARPSTQGYLWVDHISANIPVTRHQSAAAALLRPAGDDGSALRFESFFVGLEYFGFSQDDGPSLWSGVLHELFFHNHHHSKHKRMADALDLIASSLAAGALPAKK
jgi:hypothetical protein